MQTGKHGKQEGYSRPEGKQNKTGTQSPTGRQAPRAWATDTQTEKTGNA